VPAEARRTQARALGRRGCDLARADGEARQEGAAAQLRGALARAQRRRP
jgi:hypothetical protein